MSVSVHCDEVKIECMWLIYSCGIKLCNVRTRMHAIDIRISTPTKCRFCLSRARVPCTDVCSGGGGPKRITWVMMLISCMQGCFRSGLILPLPSLNYLTPSMMFVFSIQIRYERNIHSV